MSCDCFYKRASMRPVELSRNQFEARLCICSFMFHIPVDSQWNSMVGKANVLECSRVFRGSRAKPWPWALVCVWRWLPKVYIWFVVEIGLSDTSIARLEPRRGLRSER